MTGSEFHVRREPASGEGAFACNSWGSDRHRGSALPTEGAAPIPQGTTGGLRRQRFQGSQLETVQPRPPAGQEPVDQAAQSILGGRDPAGHRLGAHGPQQSPQEGPSSGFRRGRRNAPASYGWPAKAASIRGPARAASAVRVACGRVFLAGPGPVESVPHQRRGEAAQAQAGHRPRAQPRAPSRQRASPEIALAKSVRNLEQGSQPWRGARARWRREPTSYRLWAWRAKGSVAPPWSVPESSLWRACAPFP